MKLAEHYWGSQKVEIRNWATVGLGQAARHKFGIDFFNLVSSSNLPSVDISDIDVMSGIVYAGEDNAFSNGAWGPLVLSCTFYP